MIIALSDTANLVGPLREILVEEVMRRGGRVAYISSTPQLPPRVWFQNSVCEYLQLEHRIRVDYFDLSDDFPDERLCEILKYGTIHLSGGNSFDFLESLKKRNIEGLLRQHLSDQGLIVGVSAGAIVLTPSVQVAGIAGDEIRHEALISAALNILSFEFFPHFRGTHHEINQLAEYSRAMTNVLYACSDGGGLVCEYESWYSLGPVRKMQAGLFVPRVD